MKPRLDKDSKQGPDRRAFLRQGVKAGTVAFGAGLLAEGSSLFGQDQQNGQDDEGGGRLNKGDAAILRLLAAAEIVETDLWLQYSELGGVQDKEVSGINGGNPLYMAALQILDADMPQYIHDNTDDEMSHAAFLNAYLASKGEEPVNLDRFRTLPSSKAVGAQQIGRLTNLTELTVDTSWWVRYRSITNPDLGAKFDQAVPSLNKGRHTAIPRSHFDTDGSDLSNPPASILPHLQAIAFTAGFHFAFIEQGGTSLYHTLSQKVSSREVLRILVSIGGSEIMHFQTWQDKAGNALPISVTDNVPGGTGATVTFVSLSQGQPETLQANLIMPEPCDFLSKKLPPCAVIRPTGPGQIDAVGAIKSFIADGLFFGHPLFKEFTGLLLELAEEADGAKRET